MRPMAPVHPASFAQPPLPAYALLDSGDGEKLERFGEHVLSRPDPQALWRRRDPAAWGRAELVFVRESDRGGRWEAPSPVGQGGQGGQGGHGGSERPRASARPGAGKSELEWQVEVQGARFVLRTTPFKHVGLFPEQATNWSFVERAAPGLRPGQRDGGRPRLLNLFGYSGAASVLALRAGYDVTHVDASRLALAWTRTNLAATGLSADALRLVLDDAFAFARREARRGERYQAVLIDPPHHGRGPKGETWQFEADIAGLVEVCAGLLAERSLLVLSAYAIGISPWTLQNLLASVEGEVAVGELLLTEEPSPHGPARVLPCGFCARLTRGLEPL